MARKSWQQRPANFGVGLPSAASHPSPFLALLIASAKVGPVSFPHPFRPTYKFSRLLSTEWQRIVLHARLGALRSFPRFSSLLPIKANPTSRSLPSYRLSSSLHLMPITSLMRRRFVRHTTNSSRNSTFTQSALKTYMR